MTDKLFNVTVCIVTWNSAPVLRPCLESLKSQEYSNFQMVVVDNASHDESLELVWSHFPEAVVIKNNVNAGFCRAHNQAIHLSQGAYYLALNPDVSLTPGYIRELVESLNQLPEFGMAGGKLLLDAGDSNQAVIDSCGLFIDRKRRQFLRGFGQEDRGQFDQTQEVFGIDGAAPLYRRAMLEDVCIQGEYFDESFFAHKEDVDLAWRSRLLGWKAVYSPNAVAHHVRRFRPGTRDRVVSDTRIHAVKNRYYLLIKNEANITWKRDWPKILSYDLAILGYLILKEQSSLRAFKLLRQDWGRLKSWRKEIWGKVKVHDSDIEHWFESAE